MELGAFGFVLADPEKTRSASIPGTKNAYVPVVRVVYLDDTTTVRLDVFASICLTRRSAWKGNGEKGTNRCPSATRNDLKRRIRHRTKKPKGYNLREAAHDIQKQPARIEVDKRRTKIPRPLP